MWFNVISVCNCSFFLVFTCVIKWLKLWFKCVYCYLCVTQCISCISLSCLRASNVFYIFLNGEFKSCVLNLILIISVLFHALRARRCSFYGSQLSFMVNMCVSIIVYCFLIVLVNACSVFHCSFGGFQLFFTWLNLCM